MVSKSHEEPAEVNLEDVQAYSATFVDVWVVDWCGEPHLRRLKWVPLRNRDLQLEKTTLIRRALGTHQGCLQPFLGVAHLPAGGSRWWTSLQHSQLFVQPGS